jgi:SAM-dependent methyltransferase
MLENRYQCLKTRSKKIRACFDPHSQIGLEIGALNNPTISLKEGAIHYADHLSTEGLREKYAEDPNVDVNSIVNVDYVWGDKTLREAVGPEIYFDYVVASHVIEHIPDVIGWFQEISEILKPGGVLSLVIPDKRYTFDCQRDVSRPADFIEAFLLKARKPSLRQVFDSHYSSAPVDVITAWAESFDSRSVRNVHNHPIGVFNLCKRILGEDLYVDSHCYTFTPDSFVAIFELISQLDLTDFDLECMFSTEVNEIEFYVSLKKISSNQS